MTGGFTSKREEADVAGNWSTGWRRRTAPRVASLPIHVSHAREKAAAGERVLKPDLHKLFKENELAPPLLL